MDSSNSKRSLYKPAPVKNVGAKESRRALAQGHLVNESVIPEGLTVYAAPSMVSSGTESVTTISHGASSMTPPRQALASLSLSDQTPAMTSDLSSPLPRGSTTQHYTSGRSYSPPRSPPKPSPSHFLELSDSDREYMGHQRTPIRHLVPASNAPVLLVDASSHRRDQAQAEVDVRTMSIASPAKVVCHAPSIVETDLRNSGFTEEAARVHIDSVPSVTVLGDADLRAGVSADRGSPPRSADLGQASDSLRVSQEPSVASERFAATDSEASTLRPSDMSSQHESHDSRRDANASSESDRPSTAMRGASTKKKVKGKFVPSRYMQSLSKPSTPLDSSGRGPTVPQPTNSRSRTSGSRPTSAATGRPTSAATGRPPSAAAGRPTSATVGRPERTKSSNKSQRQAPIRATASFGQPSSTAHPSHHHPRPAPSSRSQFSYTPVNKKGNKRLASTPAVDTSAFPSAPPTIDASAIAASTSMFGSDMSAIAPSAGQDSAYGSLGHRQAKQLTQQDLDVMYARYLQAVFLDTKMKKKIADQEKDAMAQLYALWKENDDMSRKKAKMELKLAKLQHASMLDKQLQIQESGLGPVTARLAQFQQEYSTLAHALDTTRHQVELTDIQLPEDQDQFHHSLERALGESEHLLGEIAAVTRAKQPKVVAFSAAIDMLEQAVSNEGAELKSCQELLAATSSLCTQETSMRIQQIDQRMADK